MGNMNAWVGGVQLGSLYNRKKEVLIKLIKIMREAGGGG